LPAAAARALAVMNALATSPEGLTTSQLAQRTGIARASLGRLLESLVAGHAVLVDGEASRYFASLGIWEPAAMLMTELRVREVAFPYMVELSRAVQNQVNLAFPELPDIVYTETVLAVDGRVTSRLLYTRRPALATASGRVAVAFTDDTSMCRAFSVPLEKTTPSSRTSEPELREELARIRKAGYATIDRENDPDVSGIAVALFDGSSKAVAALGLSRHGALDPGFVETAAPRAISFAQRISAELGYRTGSVIRLA